MVGCSGSWGMGSGLSVLQRLAGYIGRSPLGHGDTQGCREGRAREQARNRLCVSVCTGPTRLVFTGWDLQSVHTMNPPPRGSGNQSEWGSAPLGS